MKRTVEAKEIDQRIAVLLDMSTVEVGDVTHIFFDELMKHLLEGNEVHIPGFGTFKVVERKGKRQSITRLNKSSNFKGNSVGETLVEVKKKYYVCFRRAHAFRDRFVMKFGKQKVVRDGEVRR